MSTETLSDLKTKTADAKRIPNPVYAAAGAGDLAYRKLRELPARALELGARAAALRPAVIQAVAEPVHRVDVDKLRAAALRNAALLREQAREQAKVAQDRAVALYADLVARGEKVVGGPYKTLAPAGDVVQATVERTDAPAATEPDAASQSGPGTGRSRARAPKKSTTGTAVK